jgi:hypothetical protein
VSFGLGLGLGVSFILLIARTTVHLTVREGAFRL